MGDALMCSTATVGGGSVFTNAPASGVWVTYREGHNYAIFATEVAALRSAVGNGGRVLFVKWGDFLFGGTTGRDETAA